MSNPAQSTREQGIRVAGTAVVLRDGAAGLETLMLRRPPSGSFAGAWVFPGGRVDPADRVGVETESDAALRAAVRETSEEACIRVHSLVPLSLWVPPPEAPAKFRTWFFLAREQGDVVHANAGEIDAAEWMTPQSAFTAHAAGSLTLFPPTWVTLQGLLDYRSVDDAFAQIADVASFETRMLPTETGMRAVWAGDEDYPDAGGAAGSRHRLTMDALPWVYERR
ncbi:NUDIX hydrolase [Microbacterium sp. H1-D42]|uniref:NUDIX hydrolase n=1 Tax=Microbacterium sp. H1-D42 TaxID=2925844 RepID=UPI001F53447B|nr:NUDIX hydrolase [Microbacterium sp. H1-D42]UNK69662.1 NUDIX hydrolase [Microbacterium sp. H1-D42]